MVNDVSERAGVRKAAFSFATLRANVRKVRWNRSCWNEKGFQDKVTFRRDVNAVNANVHTPTSWREKYRVAALTSEQAPPSTILIKDKCCLVYSAQQLPSSPFRQGVLPRTRRAPTVKRGRCFSCHLSACATSPEKTSVSFFMWLFPLITLSPSAGGGLPKKVETSDLLCPLQLRGRENGGGGGGGRLSAVENNEGGRVLRWGGCSAARGEARTAPPPTPL